jgi:tRNA (pseudouridine54-N1)-methyltransferase
MRRFVIIGQTAKGSSFSLEDLPGSSGRLDVLLRCAQAALLVSHGLRRSTMIYLVLLGDPEAPKTLRIDGRVAEYLRPDERSFGGRVRTALEWATTSEFAAERQGIAVAAGGLELVLPDLGITRPFVLEEGSADIRSALLDPSEVTFFLGDHLGFDPLTHSRLIGFGATALSVGPLSVHADHAVTLVQNELDRREK